MRRSAEAPKHCLDGTSWNPSWVWEKQNQDQSDKLCKKSWNMSLKHWTRTRKLNWRQPFPGRFPSHQNLPSLYTPGCLVTNCQWIKSCPNKIHPSLSKVGSQACPRQSTKTAAENEAPCCPIQDSSLHRKFLASSNWRWSIRHGFDWNHRCRQATWNRTKLLAKPLRIAKARCMLLPNFPENFRALHIVNLRCFISQLWRTFHVIVHRWSIRMGRHLVDPDVLTTKSKNTLPDPCPKVTVQLRRCGNPSSMPNSTPWSTHSDSRAATAYNLARCADCTSPGSRSAATRTAERADGFKDTGPASMIDQEARRKARRPQTGAIREKNQERTPVRQARSPRQELALEEPTKPDQRSATRDCKTHPCGQAGD